MSSVPSGFKNIIFEIFSGAHRFPAYGAVHLHPAAYHWDRLPPLYWRHWKTVFSYYIQCLKVDWCTLFCVNLYAKRTFSVAFYILPHCKIWDQIIHLKNISQMLTSVQRQFLLRHICQTLPVYDQISLICTVNPTDNIQKRGLTPLCQVITKKIVNFYNPFSFLFFGWFLFINLSHNLLTKLLRRKQGSITCGKPLCVLYVGRRMKQRHRFLPIVPHRRIWWRWSFTRKAFCTFPFTVSQKTGRKKGCMSQEKLLRAGTLLFTGISLSGLWSYEPGAAGKRNPPCRRGTLSGASWRGKNCHFKILYVDLPGAGLMGKHWSSCITTDPDGSGIIR